MKSGKRADYPIPSALHVDEERRRAAALCHQAITLLFDLARFLAVLAADREGQRAEPALADFLAALEAVPVGRLFEPPEGLVDLAERFGLHLDEREFDLILNVHLGALRGVQDALDGAPRAFGAHVAHPALHFAHNLAPALFEDLLQLVVAPAFHVLFGRLLTAHMRPSFPSR